MDMELGSRDSGFYPKLQTTATAQNKTRDIEGLIFMEKGRPNENMVSYLSVNEPSVRMARENYYREKGAEAEHRLCKATVQAFMPLTHSELVKTDTN